MSYKFFYTSITTKLQGAKMRRRMREIRAFCDQEMKDKIKFWMLKIILDMGGMRGFCDAEGYVYEKNILYFFELKGYEDISGRDVDPKELLKALREEYHKLSSTKIARNKNLQKNLCLLQDFFSLKQEEVEVLEFLLCMKQYSVLDDCLGLLPKSETHASFIANLSMLLGISKMTLQKILDEQSILSKTSIIEPEYHYGKYTIRDNRFVLKMFGEISSIEELFEDVIKICSHTTLTLKDYNHLKEDVNNIITYLKIALSQKIKGVNILLYGEAGTGKTEFVKAISKSLKAPLYEVSYSDDEGRYINGNERMGAYKVAQSLLKGKKLLMYDEAEDIFYGDERYLQKGKAWINRSLESNKIPTFWITNKIHKVDEAIIRRFDYVLHLPIPPKEKRKAILKKYCEDFVDEKALQELSENSNISPALVQKASAVAKLCKNKQLFSQSLDNSLKAMGYEKKKKKEPSKSTLPKSYDLSFINTNGDMRKILEGVKNNPDARICLYGVPGSGKSAYGRYLAEVLNKPCILKKGSDLLDKYVGSTEQNIALAFKEAKEKKAVLIFDEVDSFLQDRGGASRSWEVTQVNEMLTQMEEFDGIFIATTNLVDSLDKACLRRFDLKLEFKYLNASQVWGLFERECELLGIKAEKSLKEKVKSLSKISAGDFATLRRQAKFFPIENCQDFYQRLVDETKIKNQNESKIVGFASNF